MAAPMERLQALDMVEKDIIGCLQSASKCTLFKLTNSGLYCNFEERALVIYIVNLN